MELKIQREIPEQMLSDILVTAFDGGYGACWYWAEPAKEGWLQIDDKGEWLSVTIKEQEEGGSGKEGPFTVSLETIGKGIEKLFEDGVLPRRGDIRNEILSPDCALDAEGADIVVQLGLFGELVYG